MSGAVHPIVRVLYYFFLKGEVPRTDREARKIYHNLEWPRPAANINGTIQKLLHRLEYDLGAENNAEATIKSFGWCKIYLERVEQESKYFNRYYIKNKKVRRKQIPKDEQRSARAIARKTARRRWSKKWDRFTH